MRKGVRIRKQAWVKIYVAEQGISGHDNFLCRTSEATLCLLLFLCLNCKKMVTEYLLYKKMMLDISMWLRLSYCTFYPISAAMELGPCSVNTEDRAMTLKFCFSKHWYSDDLQDGDRRELLVDWMARRGRFSIILCKCKIDISAYSMFLFWGVTLSSVRNLGCQKVVNQTC